MSSWCAISLMLLSSVVSESFSSSFTTFVSIVSFILLSSKVDSNLDIPCNTASFSCCIDSCQPSGSNIVCSSSDVIFSLNWSMLSIASSPIITSDADTCDKFVVSFIPASSRTLSLSKADIFDKIAVSFINTFTTGTLLSVTSSSSDSTSSISESLS